MKNKPNGTSVPPITDDSLPIPVAPEADQDFVAFNEREVRFFAPQLQQHQVISSAINNAVAFACSLRDLDPQQWRLRQDGQGLIRAQQSGPLPPVQ